jgi:hypothetical protein
MRDTPRSIDWRRVLEDFVYLGLTGEALAQRLGLRLGLLQSFAKGTRHPAPLAADRVVVLWCELTSKAPEFVPRRSPDEPPGTDDVDGLDAEGAQEPGFTQLQDITMVWRQIARRNGWPDGIG